VLDTQIMKVGCSSILNTGLLSYFRC